MHSRSWREIVALGGVIAASAFMSGSGVAGVHAEPADADIAACPDAGKHFVEASNARDTHIGTGNVWKAGPGGTVSAAIEHNQTASVTLSRELSGTVGISEVVSASGTIGLSTQESSTISESFGYSHDVPPDMYGNIQFGNWGWDVDIHVYDFDSNCSPVNEQFGSARVPSSDHWGYNYWYTAS